MRLAHRRIWIVFFCLVLYLSTSYGGVRSPDAELLFETCDALATRGTFAIEPVSEWKGFGFSPGRDGRPYSVFGPLTSIVCVPFLRAVDAVGAERIFLVLGFPPPPSHYVPDGLLHAISDRPLEKDWEAHGRRSLVAWLYNSVVAALLVGVFHRVVSRYARSPFAIASTTWVFALGTLLWPYAGTFLSEPLTMLLVLASFDRLHGESRRDLVFSGGCLGLAVWSHVTAVLFVPFFLFLVLSQGGPYRPRLTSFGLPLALGVGGLGFLHWLHFGDPLETGRTAGVVTYGTFVAPWRGLVGLTFAPAKGLFFQAPVLLLALWGWRRFHRLHSTIAAGLAGAILFRWVFISSRSDWHGGFCSGARLLLLGLPFLLLPIACWLDAKVQDADRRGILLFGVLSLVSIAGQWQSVAGEPFVVMHLLKIFGVEAGANPFAGDRMYLHAHYAPWMHLFDGVVGPMWLRGWFDSPFILWLVGLAALSALWGAWMRAGLPRAKEQPAAEEGMAEPGPLATPSAWRRSR
jgi:hypothetical protein